MDKTTTDQQPAAVVTAADPCCQHCTALDLDNLLHYRYGRTKIKLSKEHADSISEGSTCPFCRILAAVRPPPNSTESNSNKSNGHSTADEELEIKIESPDFGVAMASGQHRPPPVILWLRNRGREGPGFVYSLTLGRAVPEMSPQVRFRSATSIDFNLLRGWLRQCHELHANFCGLVYKDSALPHTLIDCEAQHLVRGADLEAKAPYLALSYVWGKRADDEGSDATGHGQRAEYPHLPDMLPRTIEDAITVTRELGFRYLWIDRYCIDQADVEAKAIEIRRMDLIYQNATATIVAAAGDGPDHGLPGVSTRHRTPQPRERVYSHDLVTSMRNPAVAIHGSVWMTRGWTHQEALLSRRRLFFTDEQVYFECYAARSSEIVPLDLSTTRNKSSGTYMHGVFRNETLRGYGALALGTIGEYTHRTLTYQRDAIDAISGILRYYEHTLALRCYWGVPILPAADPDFAKVYRTRAVLPPGKYLSGGLCWTEAPTPLDEMLYYRRRLCGPGARRPGFPSWSWAGWHGGVGQAGSLEMREKDAADFELAVELRDGSLVDWAAFLATATAEGGGLFANTALHSPYIRVTAPSFAIPLRHFAAGQRFPATETASRYDACTNKHVPGAEVCEYDGLYAHFGKGRIYGYIYQDTVPEECELVVRISHFLPVQEELREALARAERRKEGETEQKLTAEEGDDGANINGSCAMADEAEFFGILIGPRERKRYQDVDYSTGIPAKRERDCPVESKDFVLVVRVVERRGGEGDDVFAVAERVGSLDGEILTGFTNPDLRAIRKRRFRLG